MSDILDSARVLSRLPIKGIVEVSAGAEDAQKLVRTNDDGVIDPATLGNTSTINSHIADETKHLTSAQNTLLDNVTVTASEINQLSGVTSNVQTHIIDNSKHLTSAQNTLLDALTATATELNYVSGVTSAIQTQFSNLNATNLTSGTIPNARFPATLPSINGSQITALNASNLSSGTIPNGVFPATLPALSGANLTALNANNLSSGTIPNGRIPSTLPAVNGSQLTALNATNITSGTLSGVRLPTPATNVLGGVMRNTGSPGEYVKGISTTGALEYGTPAGGGGGGGSVHRHLYVSEEIGDDSTGDGTPGTPFATIDAALAVVQAGSSSGTKYKIYIGPGYYVSNYCTSTAMPSNVFFEGSGYNVTSIDMNIAFSSGIYSIPWSAKWNIFGKGPTGSTGAAGGTATSGGDGAAGGAAPNLTLYGLTGYIVRADGGEGGVGGAGGGGAGEFSPNGGNGGNGGNGAPGGHITMMCCAFNEASSSGGIGGAGGAAGLGDYSNSGSDGYPGSPGATGDPRGDLVAYDCHVATIYFTNISYAKTNILTFNGTYVAGDYGGNSTMPVTWYS